MLPSAPLTNIIAPTTKTIDLTYAESLIDLTYEDNDANL